MRVTVAIIAVIVLVRFVGAADGPKANEFAQPPQVSKQTVSFAVRESPDVEVAALNVKNQVIRHLAAGVLGGKNPPPAPASRCWPAPGLHARQPVEPVSGLRRPGE